MQIVGKVAATMQQVFGPHQRTRADHGCYPTCSQIHRHQPVADARPESARKPNAKIADFQSTAAQLGLDVTTTAIEHRFTPQLVTFLRSVLEQIVHRAMAAASQPVDLPKQFTSIRIGDSSTLAVPEELADQFPGCGGKSGSGQASPRPPAVGLPHRLDSPTADYPGTPQRRDQSHRPGGAPGRVAVVVRPGLLRSGAIRQDRAGRRFLDLAAAARDVGLRRRGPSLAPAAIPAAADGAGADRCVGFARRDTSSALPIDRTAGAPRSGRPAAAESPREGPKAWPHSIAGLSPMARLDDLRDQLPGRDALLASRGRALPCGGRLNLCSNSGNRTTAWRRAVLPPPPRNRWR